MVQTSLIRCSTPHPGYSNTVDLLQLTIDSHSIHLTILPFLPLYPLPSYRSLILCVVAIVLPLLSVLLLSSFLPALSPLPPPPPRPSLALLPPPPPRLFLQVSESAEDPAGDNIPENSCADNMLSHIKTANAAATGNEGKQA
jgi:hypothetical protein